MTSSELETPFAVIFILVAWAGEEYEVDFLNNVCFLEGHSFKNVFFTNGVAVGDLGAQIAPKFSQQRFLDVIF